MNKRCIIIFVCLAMFISLISGADAKSTGIGAYAANPNPDIFVLSSFEYDGVSIDGGHMGALYEEVGCSYLKLTEDVDSLLKGFRERAGMPAPGDDLEIGYTDAVYHMFGQLISGLARYYASTKDPIYKERVNSLVHEWGLTIEDDGFFFYTDPPKTTHYVYEKMAGAMVDAYLYCGNEEALEYLSRITDWAINNLPRNRHPWTYAAEWYTLSETLYRAYLATGNEKYREFAEVWHYREYWDLYVDNIDIFNSPPWEAKPEVFHAYSHVNTLSGAAMAYIVTEEENYLKTIVNAYDFFMNEQTFATGGYGPDEQLRPLDGLIESLAFTLVRKNFETQCGSWAAFKLSKYLMTLTGNDKYGDWVELLLFNGIGASLPTGDRAEVMYSSDYHLGGGKKVYAQPWTCCTGTRVMATADYIDQIYFKDENNIYVSLYTPSRVNWSKDGKKVEIIQETAFPEENKVAFNIVTDGKVEFGLRFREPSWITGPMSAKVNGVDAKLDKLDSGWLAVDRVWEDGDKVEVTLPMGLHISRMDPQSQYPCAIMYGPVVLAIEGERPNDNPAKLIDLDSLDDMFVPVEGKPLHFTINTCVEDSKGNLKTLTAKPFYEYELDELYYMYLDPKWVRKVSNKPIVEKPDESEEDPEPSSTMSPGDDETEYGDSETEGSENEESKQDKPGNELPETYDKGIIAYLTIILAAFAAILFLSVFRRFQSRQ